MCVQKIDSGGLTAPEAAQEQGVSTTTARKWLGRYVAEGEAGLRDASSRPANSPRATEPSKPLAILELRRKRLTQARIAAALGISKSTVGRVLARAGLSRLANLEPAEPVRRYAHDAPSEMLHINTKKLGRIEAIGHRATGDRRDRTRGAGWETLFVAINGHARFTDMYPEENKPQGSSFCAMQWRTTESRFSGC